MAVKASKKRRVVEDEEDEEPEEKPFSNGKIKILRTMKRKDVPAARMPGSRNPEYEKLVRRLIKLEARQEAVVIPVESKDQKQKIREGVRKPLRVRGYNLTATTQMDDEEGEVLILFATKIEQEEPDEEETSTRRKKRVRNSREEEDSEEEEEEDDE
jgi:hypothetical protein